MSRWVGTKIPDIYVIVFWRDLSHATTPPQNKVFERHVTKIWKMMAHNIHIKIKDFK